MTNRVILEKLVGAIGKLEVLRTEPGIITDDYCSFTVQLRHYRNMYKKLKRVSRDKIRRYNDAGVII